LGQTGHGDPVETPKTKGPQCAPKGGRGGGGGQKKKIPNDCRGCHCPKKGIKGGNGQKSHRRCRGECNKETIRQSLVSQTPRLQKGGEGWYLKVSRAKKKGTAPAARRRTKITKGENVSNGEETKINREGVNRIAPNRDERGGGVPGFIKTALNENQSPRQILLAK